MKWKLSQLPGKPRTAAQLKAEIAYFEYQLSLTKSPDRIRRMETAINIRKSLLEPMLKWKRVAEKDRAERQLAASGASDSATAFVSRHDGDNRS
jgi:hypothetical protein